MHTLKSEKMITSATNKLIDTEWQEALIDRAHLVVVFGFLVQVGVVVLVHKVPGKPFKRQAAALS